MAQGKSYYFIRSRLNGLVLDVEAGNKSPGTRVIMYQQKQSNNDNQLWYDDLQTGTIRSKLNDFCLEFNGRCIVVQPYSAGNNNQQWERSGQFIRMRHQPNTVLDITEANKHSGAGLCAYNHHGGANQCFEFVAKGVTTTATSKPAGGGGCAKPMKSFGG